MRHWMRVAALLAAASWMPLATQASAIRQGVDELAAAAGPHRLIVLGEAHGTREIPDLVEALVAHYAAEGPVLLALEVRRGEHAVLARYLDAADHRRFSELRQREAWSRPPEDNDGRRTQDMLDLVEAMRRLRAAGRDVALFPYDIEGPSGGSQARDRAMAEYLRRGFAALPRGRMLVLTGNVHAMLFKPRYCQQCQTPMTSYLHDLGPYSVDIVARAGSSWGCRDRCGPMAVLAQPGLQTGPVATGSIQPFHFKLVLPTFTPANLVGAE